MSTPASAIIRHLIESDASAVIVADGPADDIIARMVAVGWTLKDETTIIAGKRVRYIVPPDCLTVCDDDCESGQVHCYWIHEPSSRTGWHSPQDCPMKGAK
jgi:hypothetical protein